MAERVVHDLSAPFLDEPPVVELAVRIADAVGRFMAQDQRRGPAVFACEAPIVVEAN